MFVESVLQRLTTPDGKPIAMCVVDVIPGQDSVKQYRGALNLKMCAKAAKVVPRSQVKRPEKQKQKSVRMNMYMEQSLPKSLKRKRTNTHACMHNNLATNLSERPFRQLPLSTPRHLLSQGHFCGIGLSWLKTPFGSHIFFNPTKRGSFSAPNVQVGSSSPCA